MKWHCRRVCYSNCSKIYDLTRKLIPDTGTLASVCAGDGLIKGYYLMPNCELTKTPKPVGRCVAAQESETLTNEGTAVRCHWNGGKAVGWKSLVMQADASMLRHVTGSVCVCVWGGGAAQSCCVPWTEQSSNQNTIHHAASHKCDVTSRTVPCQGTEVQKSRS